MCASSGDLSQQSHDSSLLNATPVQPRAIFMTLLNLKYIGAIGVPDGIRSHGLKIRNRALYPAELREPQANISFSWIGCLDR